MEKADIKKNIMIVLTCVAMLFLLLFIIFISISSSELNAIFNGKGSPLGVGMFSSSIVFGILFLGLSGYLGYETYSLLQKSKNKENNKKTSKNKNVNYNNVQNYNDQYQNPVETYQTQYAHPNGYVTTSTQEIQHQVIEHKLPNIADNDKVVIRSYLRPGQVLPKGYAFDEVSGRLVRVEDYNHVIQTNTHYVNTPQYQSQEYAHYQPEQYGYNTTTTTQYTPSVEQYYDESTHHTNYINEMHEVYSEQPTVTHETNKYVEESHYVQEYEPEPEPETHEVVTTKTTTYTEELIDPNSEN